MYPLSMKLKEGIGFAVANDADEHAALEAAGYGPGRTTGGGSTGSTAPATATQADLAAAVRAQLDAASISYPEGLGLTKLVALLPKE